MVGKAFRGPWGQALGNSPGLGLRRGAGVAVAMGQTVHSWGEADRWSFREGARG